MPNTYLKPEKQIALALAMLEKRATLPLAFKRIDGGAFRGARNDTLTAFRTPGITRARDYEWRTRTAPIVLDRIARSETTITMNDHMYNAVPITDEEATLDLTSFQEEILSPQVDAIVQRADAKIFNTLVTNNAFKRTDLVLDETKGVLSQLLGIKSVLDAQGTPKANRKLLVGANAANWIRLSGDLKEYDREQATSTFRRATLGNVADFDLVEWEGIEDDSFYAVHESAIVFANIAPVVPEGAVYGVRQSFRSWALRLIRDYDSNYAQDRSFVSTFGGVAPVKDELQMVKDPLGYYVPDLDAEGEPIYTGFNVRGSSGQFVAAPVV